MEASTDAANPEPHPLNVLVWHVHGSWMTSFVHGGHNYLLPTDPAEPEWALGRAGQQWPDNAREVAPADLVDEQIDVVVLQRPYELELVRQWLRRTPGVDIPAVYVEHSAPREHAALSEHPLADRTDIPLVHVTHFNELMWDNGRCPVTVIQHGILDPGNRYSGELARAATMINDPQRRGRITGTDLLSPLSEAAPIDVYGIGTDGLPATLGLSAQRVRGCGDHEQAQLHAELARRRVFVHTPRWTSLGLSVLEAMYLGMPIVAVATTEAPVSIPVEAGVVSTEVDVLAEGIRQFIHEPFFAELAGKAARHWAQTNYGIDEFTRNWGQLLTDTVATHPAARQ